MSDPHSDERLILAIDQGTSLTKVLALNLDGCIVARASADTPVSYPSPERAESDADCWWPVVASCIRDVLATGIAPERIEAIGPCGFMHTLVPVEASGKALHPAMLWPDQRCSRQVEELAEHADTVARISGRPLSTLSSVPRMRWLSEHAPEIVKNAAWWLSVKDVLRFHLTGEVATDSYDAHGTGLLDEATGDWSEELLKLAEVDPAQMPPIRRPDDIGGYVTESAAAASGLLAGTPVVVGSGDWFSTLVGSGCYLPRRTCFYLGSAGILGSFTSEAELNDLGRTRYFGSVTSTGTALQWIRALLYEGDGSADHPVSYALVCADGEDSETGARGLLFLPHLMGERGGRMRPEARGVLYGLTLAHNRHDVVRAVLEGTAMWLRATCEPQLRGVDTGDLVAFGGGAGSALWLRICAAVFNRRLLIPANAEGAGLGAAMMAAVGSGWGGYAELARRWVKINSTQTPDPQLVEAYRILYGDFRRLESTVARLT